MFFWRNQKYNQFRFFNFDICIKKLKKDIKKTELKNVISVGRVKTAPIPKGKIYANKYSDGDTANAIDGMSID